MSLITFKMFKFWMQLCWWI